MLIYGLCTVRMVVLVLLLLPFSVSSCDSTVYPATTDLYVQFASSPGVGSECSPFNSLLAALQTLSSSGGHIHLQSPASLHPLPSLPLSPLFISGLNHTLLLSVTLTITAELTLSDVILTPESQFSAFAFDVKGKFTLIRCSVNNFKGSFVNLWGVLVIKEGNFSGNFETIVISTDLTVEIYIENAFFESNYGKNAAILDYQVTSLESPVFFPNISLSNLQVSHSIPSFFLKYHTKEAKNAQKSGIYIENGAFLGAKEVIICDIEGLKVVLSGGFYTGKVKISNSNQNIEVKNVVFEGENGGLWIEKSIKRVEIAEIACFGAIQCVNIAANAANCVLSGLKVTQGGGKSAILYAKCGNLHITGVEVEHVTGPVMKFYSVTSGDTRDMQVTHCTVQSTEALIDFTDLTSHSNLTISHSHCDFLLLCLHGALPVTVLNMHIDNSTSSTSLVGNLDTIQYTLNAANIRNSYSKAEVFMYRSTSPLYTVYRNVRFDGVSSDVAIWSVIGNARATVLDCYFNLRNINMPVIDTSSYQFTYSNIEVTGQFRTFIQGKPSLPFSLTSLHFHDILCNGLFQGSSFTFSLQNAVFRNVTVINPELNLQDSMKITIFNVYLERFQGQMMNLVDTNAEIENFVVENCEALNGNSLILASQSKVSFKNANFTDFSGNILKITESSEVLISNSTFNRLKISSNSGFLSLSHSNLTIKSLFLTDFSSSFISASLSSISTFHSHISHSSNTSSSANGGYIYAENCALVLIDSSYLGEVAGYDGGVVHVVNSNPGLLVAGSEYGRFVVLVNCTFEGNRGDRDGGGVYVEDASAWVEDCWFEGNRAGRSGGALLMKCNYAETSYYCNYTLINTRLSNNHADQSGGGFAYNSILPSTLNITDSGNSAPYGDFQAGYPVLLRPIPSGTQEFQAESGVIVTNGVKLGLFDLHGQLVTTADRNPAIVRGESSAVTVMGVTRQFPEQGVYHFDDFSVLDLPGTSVRLLFQSESLTYTNPDPNTGLTPVPVPITAHLRVCFMGEIQSSSICTACPSGSYSFNTTDAACSNCITGLQCLGGADVLTKSGYWRPSNETDSVYRCPYSEVCLGGLQSECETGYEGRLCSVCASDYLRLGKFQCSPCGSTASTLATGIFLVIACLFLIVYLIYSAIYSAKTGQSVIGPLMKILLNYIQTFSLVTGFNMRWPYEILKFTDGLSMIGSGTSNAFSINCLSEIGDFNEREIYLKLVFLTVLPAVLMLVSGVVWGVVAYVKQSYRYLTEHAVCTAIVVVLTLHSNILSATLAMVACQRMESGSVWLIADYTQECWTGSHAYYTLTSALPAFLLWVLFCPLFILISLIRSHSHLTHPSTQLRFSFLFTGYKPTLYFWEFVILTRKICMLALQNTLSSSSSLVQVFATLILLYLFYQLHIKQLPFNLPKLNFAEGISILSVIINTISGVLLTFDKSNSVIFEVTIVILYILSTGVFLGFWVVTMGLMCSKRLGKLIGLVTRREIVRPYSYAQSENELNQLEVRRQPL